MPTDRALTDAELLSVFHDKRADLSLLSREERHRLVTLTEPKMSADPNPPKPERPRTWTDTAIDALPMIGGTAGGMIGGAGGTAFGVGFGGVPGAIGGATLGGAAGESLRELANRVRGQAAPMTSGAAAKDIALQGGIQGGAEALGAGITKGVTAGAKAVYRGYLKPSLSQRMLPKANEIVETALNEALPISKRGVQTAGRVIGELRNEVDDILAQSPDTLDLHAVADKVRAFAKARYYKPGVDLADYQLALNVADKLDLHPSLNLAPGAAPAAVDVPLAAANESKRGLYTSIKEAGFGTPQGAKKTTEKFAAHEIKTGLEAAAPEIAPLNARESKLIDAAKAIAKAVEREANQSKLYGVKTLASVGVGSGSYATGDDLPTAVGKGLATRALLNPGAQSLGAIVATRIAKELGVGTATAARLAAMALRGSEQQPQQQGHE